MSLNFPISSIINIVYLNICENFFNYLNISHYKFTDDRAAIQKWETARSAMIYKDEIDR